MCFRAVSLGEADPNFAAERNLDFACMCKHPEVAFFNGTYS